MGTALNRKICAKRVRSLALAWILGKGTSVVGFVSRTMVRVLHNYN
jgi:hypothetical protein